MNRRSQKRQIIVPSSVFMGLFSIFLCCLFVCGVLGQATELTIKNNPYSPSPASNVITAEASVTPRSRDTVGIADVTFTLNGSSEKKAENPSQPLVQRSPGISRNGEFRSQPPTEMYKVGAGDVLFINLKNSPQGSGFYTVRENGTIDYPLAGDDVSVTGHTTDAIVGILKSGVTLFPNPEFEVKVREYSSHKINVKGAVEHPGEKSLQREAIPLFVIRAEAGVDSRAKKVLIQRAPFLAPESYELTDESTDKQLIFPGNSIEFLADSERRPFNLDHYFISGSVASSGVRVLRPGITLLQAAIEAGNPKDTPKKATIRRKDGSGLITTYKYDLRSIKDGKATDPLLKPGDVVEIDN